MKNRVLTSWMLLFFIFLIYENGKSQRIEPIQFLEGTTVYDVARDHNGTMWFGTNTGLVRYDGYETVTLSTTDGLPGNEILRLHVSKDNRLWLLNFNGNPAFIEDGIIYTPQNTHWLEQAISSEPHTSIYSTDDTVYIASEYGDVKIIKDNEVRSVTPLGFFQPLFNLVKDGQLLYMLDNDQKELFSYDLESREILEKKTINGIRSSRMGLVQEEPYVPTENGITSMRINADLPDFNFSERGVSENIICFAYTDDRYFAVGTESGLYFINRDSHAPAVKVLDDYFISSLLYDIEGNIWVTTLGHGALLFPASFWKPLRVTASELNISRFLSATFIGNTIALGGSSDKLFWLNSKSNTEIFPLDLSLDIRAEINQIVYHDGVLAIGTVERTYIADVTDEHTFPSKFTSVEISSTKRIHIHNRDSIYVASIEGIHRLTRNDSGIFENNYEYLGRSTTVLKTQQYGVVFGTSNGVYFIEDDIIIPLIEELEGQQVTALTQTTDASVFVGTNGAGLWRIKDGNANWVFPEMTRLKSVRQIKEADDGSVWIATSQGLFRLMDESIELFDEGNFNNVALKDREILYTTTETAILSTQQPPNPKPVDLKLFEYMFLVDNQPVWNNEEYRFPHNTQTITVEARAPFYRKQHELEYHYTFDQNGNNWQISKLPELIFREQPPGKYTLQIKAVVPSENLSSEPVIIRYEIIPPVWQRLWFVLLTVGLVIAILLVGFDARLKIVRRKEAEKLKQYTKMVELEQQALSAMMNPHFVFNVLNSIRYYMGGETPEKAQDYLAQFARLIRLQLESSFNKNITLIQEIERLEHYVKLESLRLKYPLSFSICKGDLTEDDLEELKVPPMLLQPFIENSIWHGIQPKNEKGSIEIQFSMIGQDFLEIIITDDGIGIDESRKQTINKEREHASLAMHLIKERLQLLSAQTGRQATIKTESKSESGTKVTLTLPV